MDLRKLYSGDKKSISEIASIFKMSCNGIRKRMIRAGIERRTISESLIVKYKTQPTNLNLTMTPNLACVLGVCYGDGSVCRYYDKWSRGGYRHVISLEVPEKELALSFKVALEKCGFKPKLSYYLPKNVYRVRQYSKEFYNWFKAISLDDLTNLFQDESYAGEFIRSFYECEGCLCRLHDKRWPNYLKYQLSITNTNLEILLLIKGYLKKMGLSLGMRRWNTPHGTKTVHQIYTSDKKKIARFLGIIKPTIKNEFQKHSPANSLFFHAPPKPF